MSRLYTFEAVVVQIYIWRLASCLMSMIDIKSRGEQCCRMPTDHELDDVRPRACFNSFLYKECLYYLYAFSLTIGMKHTGFKNGHRR